MADEKDSIAEAIAALPALRAQINAGDGPDVIGVDRYLAVLEELAGVQARRDKVLAVVAEETTHADDITDNDLRAWRARFLAIAEAGIPPRPHNFARAAVICDGLIEERKRYRGARDEGVRAYEAEHLRYTEMMGARDICKADGDRALAALSDARAEAKAALEVSHSTCDKFETALHEEIAKRKAAVAEQDRLRGALEKIAAEEHSGTRADQLGSMARATLSPAAPVATPPRPCRPCRRCGQDTHATADCQTLLCDRCGKECDGDRCDDCKAKYDAAPVAVEAPTPPEPATVERKCGVYDCPNSTVHPDANFCQKHNLGEWKPDPLAALTGRILELEGGRAVNGTAIRVILTRLAALEAGKPAATPPKLCGRCGTPYAPGGEGHVCAVEAVRLDGCGAVHSPGNVCLDHDRRFPGEHYDGDRLHWPIVAEGPAPALGADVVKTHAVGFLTQMVCDPVRVWFAEAAHAQAWALLAAQGLVVHVTAKPRGMQLTPSALDLYRLLSTMITGPISPWSPMRYAELMMAIAALAESITLIKVSR